MDFSIVKFNDADHVRTEVDCVPFGMRCFLCEVFEGDPNDVREVMELIVADWLNYWSKARETVQALFKSYEEPDHFQKADFQIFLKKSGGWVDDDFFFEIKFEQGRFWAVFFKDGEVIHSQVS